MKIKSQSYIAVLMTYAAAIHVSLGADLKSCSTVFVVPVVIRYYDGKP